MNKIICTIAIAITLSACATPTTTLKNKKTGQVATCGGSSTGSFVGGAIGYHVQKDNDESCVKTYQKQGFKVIDRTEN
jgi:hypothetical protein